MKWEYMLLKNVNIDKMVPDLNKLGVDGWEAISLSGGVKFGLTKGEHMALLKRPLAG